MFSTTQIECGLVVAIVGVFVLMVAVLLSRRGRTALPYRRKPLLSPWERNAFGTLTSQLRPGLHLCAQVRLADLLSVVERDPSRRQTALNRVSSKSIDFVVVEIASGKALLAIELDDRSHDREDRKLRDRFVNAVFEHVGIPIVRFRPTDRLNIRQHLEEAQRISA